MKIVRLTKNLKAIGIPIPESDVPKYVKSNESWFKSLYYFDQEIVDYYKEHGRFEGFNGRAYTNFLVFDMDAKDLEVSRRNTIRLIEYLKGRGLYTEEAAIISFSGSKGFHLFINTDFEFSDKQLKAICMNLSAQVDFDYTAGFKLDPSIYNKTRPFRLVNTTNEKSKLHKINVTEGDLRHFTADELAEYAKTTQPEFTYTDVISKDKIEPILEELDRLVEEEIEYEGEATLILHDRPCIKSIEAGNIGDGESNTALIRLAAHYRDNGVSKEEAFSRINDVACSRLERYPDTNPIGTTKIKYEIINPAYRSGYKFGCSDDYLRSKCGDLCPSRKVKAINIPKPLAEKPVETPKQEVNRGGFRANLPLAAEVPKPEGRGFKKMKDSAKSRSAFITEIKNRTIVTGIKKLDNLCKIIPSGLVIINARPSVGKTTLLFNILTNSTENGQTAAVYSIDMDESEFHTKSKSAVMKLTPDEVLALEMDPESESLMAEADEKIEKALASANIKYDKRVTLQMIADDLAYMHENNEMPSVIIIDYIQKMVEVKNDPGYALNFLKELQAKYMVNMIILSQIPRSTGSSSIDETTPIYTAGASLGGTDYEANCSIMINLWRPFKHRREWDKYLSFFIAKNRMGACEEGVLYFNGAVSEVRDCTQEELEQYHIWKTQMEEEKKAKRHNERARFRNA